MNFQKLIDKGGNFYFSEAENMVHHKFFIIDNNTVITGSYNWTYYAENRNWENVVVLSETEIVKGYIEEFEKIIDEHKIVSSVSERINLTAAVSPDDYIQTDYLFQARSEFNKGNELYAAELFSNAKEHGENKKAESISTQKQKAIVFDVSPFEIGIKFTDGYSMVIPAFTKLPFTTGQKAVNSYDNESPIEIIIQKNDYRKETIFQTTLDNVALCPAGTLNMGIFFSFKCDGILNVQWKELNGNKQVKDFSVDIKQLV